MEIVHLFPFVSQKHKTFAFACLAIKKTWHVFFMFAERFSKQKDIFYVLNCVFPLFSEMPVVRSET